MTALDVFLVILTIAAYGLACGVARRHPHPLLQPVVLSAGLIMLVLARTGVSFADYRPAKAILTWPLGPATVALAVPIYNQRGRLRAVALPLLCGVVLGTLASIAVAVGLAALSRLDAVVVHSLPMKSVTTAVAVELARLGGGDPALAAVFVVATASIGATIGPWALSRCRVDDPAARGIALGTIAAAMGTAAAWREDELAGALGGLAIFVTALATTLLLPAYFPWLLWLARQ